MQNQLFFSVHSYKHFINYMLCCTINYTKTVAVFILFYLEIIKPNFGNPCYSLVLFPHLKHTSSSIFAPFTQF